MLFMFKETFKKEHLHYIGYIYNSQTGKRTHEIVHFDQCSQLASTPTERKIEYICHSLVA